jgi:glycosyltransferase involved in cell wall biosynthesis
MTDIKISVVIPMYNAEGTIKKTLNSILNQNYQDSIEVLIVNDGSNDNSENIVKDFIKNNTSKINIKIFNQKNQGVSIARNKGITQAQGNWIAFLDSDDVWLNDKLKKQISVLKENQDIEFLGCNKDNEIYPFFNKAKQTIYTLTAKNLIFKWFPATSTILIKKEILLKVGLFNETLTHGEDIDLWLRLVNITKMYILNKSLVSFGDGKRGYGESGLSANISKMHQGELFTLKGVNKRGQINLLEYYIFYLWLSTKYIRRIIICNIVKS